MEKIHRTESLNNFFKKMWRRKKHCLLHKNGWKNFRGAATAVTACDRHIPPSVCVYLCGTICVCVTLCVSVWHYVCLCGSVLFMLLLTPPHK